MSDKVITYKGRKYLRSKALRMAIPMPKKLTKRGERLAEKMAQEAADSLLSFYKKRFDRKMPSKLDDGSK